MILGGNTSIPKKSWAGGSRASDMTTVTIQEAQLPLTDLIHQMSSGEEVVITENDQPVARLIHASAVANRKARQLGTMKGSVLYMAPDFDAPLEDFKEYAGFAGS